MTVISEDEASKCDEELGQRGMNVDEVLRLDVLGRELAKVNFVEAMQTVRRV